MKLFYSHTSPYARKVRLAIRAKGLLDQVEEIACDAFAPPPELRAANPLEKIPVLILSDGSSLFDSPVICQYLDSLSDQLSLFPASDALRWQVLRWAALCDGLMDSSYNLVMENKRPDNEQSQEWQDLWQRDIRRILIHLEQSLSELPEGMSQARLTKLG